MKPGEATTIDAAPISSSSISSFSFRLLFCSKVFEATPGAQPYTPRMPRVFSQLNPKFLQALAGGGGLHGTVDVLAGLRQLRVVRGGAFGVAALVVLLHTLGDLFRQCTALVGCASPTAPWLFCAPLCFGVYEQTSVRRPKKHGGRRLASPDRLLRHWRRGCLRAARVARCCIAKLHEGFLAPCSRRCREFG